MGNNPFIINPRTKLMQLLETYPQLEEVLIRYVPAFKKLKNPVLRRTVARIATLQQVANIGNVKVGDLINLLRKEVGQDLYTGDEESVYNTKKPGWFDESLISREFDIREMLAAGEQPVNQVISDLNELPEGKIYKLIAPFLPAPLIDKASSLGVGHWVDKTQVELFTVYFFKGIK
ncbi:MAG: DUF1858 domain-containing protein [Chlorobi bacterium]|nr:DUF1858 domain-containing protein [Chlorobiota bacterium]